MRDSKCNTFWQLGVGGFALVLGLAMIPHMTQAASPDTISGLTVWFNADSIGQGDGTDVTDWDNDATSGLIDATGPGSEATYETGEINGHAVVRFASGEGLGWEKAGDAAATWADAGLTTGVTHFAVVKPTSSDNSYAGHGTFRYVARTTKINVSRLPNNSIGVLTTAIGEPIIHATTMSDISDGVVPTCSSSINGFYTVSNTGPGSSSGLSSDRVYLGNHDAGGAWAGDIAEFIVYDRVLSASEIESVGLYLAAKYGIRAYASDGKPDTVPGLKVWFNADSIGQGDGTDVLAWTNDAYSNLDEATGPGGEATYETGEINGHAVVRFAAAEGLGWEEGDGSAASWGDAGMSSGVTHFAVVDPSAADHSYAGDDDFRYVVRTTKSNVSRTPNNSIGEISGAISAPIVHATTMSDISDGVVPTCFATQNGFTSVTNVGPSSSSGLGTARVYLGNHPGPRDWAGDIAEVLVYCRVLSEAEFRTVGFYLGAKYGIETDWAPELGTVISVR